MGFRQTEQDPLLDATGILVFVDHDVPHVGGDRAGDAGVGQQHIGQRLQVGEVQGAASPQHLPVAPAAAAQSRVEGPRRVVQFLQVDPLIGEPVEVAASLVDDVALVLPAPVLQGASIRAENLVEPAPHQAGLFLVVQEPMRRLQTNGAGMRSQDLMAQAVDGGDANPSHLRAAAQRLGGGQEPPLQFAGGWFAEGAEH